MNWIKSNWLILVLTVVALAALPSMYYFSTKLSKELRAKVEKDVVADYRDVTNSKVPYNVPSVKQPDAKSFEKTVDVNPILTRKVAELREKIKAESALIGTEAVKFNENGHKPLIPDLFPKPTDQARAEKTHQFARAFVVTAPQTMLDAVSARGPTDAKELGNVLNEYKTNRTKSLLSKSGNTMLSPEQMQLLTDELVAQRLGAYRAHASRTNFYADTNIYVEVPTQVPSPIPPMSRLWDWQLKSWIYEDLFKAVSLANASAGGGGQGNILTGAIKRIGRINVQPPDYTDTDDSTPAEMIAEAAVNPPKDPVVPDMTASLTGRIGGPTSGNSYYDLRTTTIEVIVAPDKLPYFFDALAATNYMTVLKLEMETFEQDKDLREGYYYGDDHVVRAYITIETIWLRAWTKKYMPKTVKHVLGITDEKPADQPPQ